MPVYKQLARINKRVKKEGKKRRALNGLILFPQQYKTEPPRQKHYDISDNIDKKLVPLKVLDTGADGSKRNQINHSSRPYPPNRFLNHGCRRIIITLQI